MKKNLLCFVAIIAAVGITSFTRPEKKDMAANSMLYWFRIEGQYWPSLEVLQCDAAFISASPFYPEGLGCSFGFYQCVSGFNVTQVCYDESTHTYSLIDDYQVPEVVAYRKLF